MKQEEYEGATDSEDIERLVTEIEMLKFVLSFDAYNETIQDAEHVREQVKGLRESFDYLKSKVLRLIELQNLSQQNFEETFMKLNKCWTRS